MIAGMGGTGGYSESNSATGPGIGGTGKHSETKSVTGEGGPAGHSESKTVTGKGQATPAECFSSILMASCIVKCRLACRL